MDNKMITRKRFTLRQEYFGGIIHDSKNMFCEIISPGQFDLLANMTNGQNGTIHENDLSVDIQKLKDKGIISTDSDGLIRLNNIRLVDPPAIIPDDCLTAPLRIYHTITRKCNLDCKQCLASSTADFVEERMTIDQIKMVMQKFYDMGCMEWRFTGGEPTSYPDLIEAIQFAKGLGMAVMLNTNGCWSKKMSETIPTLGLDEIILSLEGREEINDSRHNPGVYKKVLQAMDLIAAFNQANPDQKIKVTLNMTIARDNVDEVEYVIRLGASYGFNVNFVPLRPYGRTLTNLQGVMLSTKEFKDFSENVQQIRELPEVKDSGIKVIHRNMDLFCPDYPDKSELPFPFNYSACGALSTGFGLCPDGRVNACSFLMDDPEFVGPSLLDSTVQEAWLDDSMEHFRKAKKVGCPNCEFYMNQCEGKCQAMVLANNGEIKDNKLIGHDPYCYRALMQKEQ